jgi:hypothetical protein
MTHEVEMDVILIMLMEFTMISGGHLVAMTT